MPEPARRPWAKLHIRDWVRFLEDDAACTVVGRAIVAWLVVGLREGSQGGLTVAELVSRLYRASAADIQATLEHLQRIRIVVETDGCYALSPAVCTIPPRVARARRLVKRRSYTAALQRVAERVEGSHAP